MYTKRKIKLKHNPLSPLAWIEDDAKHGYRAGKEWHIGVHVADNLYTAAAYAVSKAAQQRHSKKFYNCGAVVKLDTTGLQPQADIDGHRVTLELIDLIQYGFDELKKLTKAYLRNQCSANMLYKEIRFNIDTNEFPEPEVNSWVSALTYLANNSSYNPVQGLLLYLEDQEINEILYVLRHLFKINTDAPQLDDIYGSIILGQYRYMIPIEIDRVLEIKAIKPVELTLMDLSKSDTDFDKFFDEQEKYDDEPSQFTLEEYQDANSCNPERLLPDENIEIIYENSDPIKIQKDIFLKEHEERRIQYHGTDLIRLRKALPEIREDLISPWNFNQPTGPRQL